MERRETVTQWYRTVLCSAVGLAMIIVACEGMTEANHSQITAPDLQEVEHSKARVDICHLNDRDEYHLITISQAALDAHIAHGDGIIGDDVPGMEGYIFDEECRLEESNTFDSYCFVDVPGFGVKNCCDGIDNNSSGLIDCQDPVCAAALSCQF